MRVNEVSDPASQGRIHDAIVIAQEPPMSSNRKIIRSGSVYHLGYIGSAQGIVASRAETGKPLSSVPWFTLRLRGPFVGHALGEGIVRQKRKTRAELMLIDDLHGTVRTGGGRRHKGSIGSEIRKGDVPLDGRTVLIRARRHDGGRRVLRSLAVQMPAKGANVTDRDSIMIRELVLNRQVGCLLIGRLEIVLPA